MFKALVRPTRRALGIGGVAALIAASVGLSASGANADEPAAAETEYAFADLWVTTDPLTYDHRTVDTLSGWLLKMDPETGDWTSAAGETVELVQRWEEIWSSDPVPDETYYDSLGQVTTDEYGIFHLEDAEIRHRDTDQNANGEQEPIPGPFPVVINATHPVDPEGRPHPSNWDASEPFRALVATPAESRMRAAFDVGDAVPDGGREVTVEGAYERRDGEGWTGLEGFEIEVEYLSDDEAETFEQTVETDEDGGFSVTFTVPVTGTVYASIEGRWHEDAFLDLVGAQYQSARVTVP